MLSLDLWGWRNTRAGTESSVGGAGNEVNRSQNVIKIKIKMNQNYAWLFSVVAVVLLVSSQPSELLRPVLIFTGALVKIRKVPNFSSLAATSTLNRLRETKLPTLHGMPGRVCCILSSLPRYLALVIQNRASTDLL